MNKEYQETYIKFLKEENRVNELAYVEKYGIEKMPIYIHGDREKLFGELLKSGKPAEQLKDIPKGIIF
jgi:hypothetical protein